MNKLWVAVICLLVLGATCARSQREAQAIYMDPQAPIPDRVRDLLGRMTVDEKVAQLESGWTLPAFGTFKVPSPIEGNRVNEAVAAKIAGNGLGTYAFLDEFLGSNPTA